MTNSWSATTFCSRSTPSPALEFPPTRTPNTCNAMTLEPCRYHQPRRRSLLCSRRSQPFPITDTLVVDNLIQRWTLFSWHWKPLGTRRSSHISPRPLLQPRPLWRQSHIVDLTSTISSCPSRPRPFSLLPSSQKKRKNNNQKKKYNVYTYIYNLLHIFNSSKDNL